MSCMIATVVDLGAKVVGAVGVVITLGYTGCQIQVANRNTEAQLVYQIQKDGRELLLDAMANNDFRDCIVLEHACGVDALSNAETEVRRMFQFYSAVKHQIDLGMISKKFWNIWSSEVCEFSKNNRVKTFWADVQDSSSINPSLRSEVDKCIKQ